MAGPPEPQVGRGRFAAGLAITTVIGGVALVVLSSKNLAEDFLSAALSGIPDASHEAGLPRVGARWARIETGWLPPRFDLIEVTLAELSEGAEKSAAGRVAPIFARAERVVVWPRVGALLAGRLEVGSLQIDGAPVAVASNPRSGAWQLVVEGLPLAVLGPWIAGAQHLGGRASGTITLEGVAGDPVEPIAFRGAAPAATLVLDLEIQDAAFSLDDISVAGALSLDARARRAQTGLEGDFSIDATAARLSLAGAYEKPPGDEATLEGRFSVATEAGLVLDEVRYHARRARLSVGGDARP